MGCLFATRIFTSTSRIPCSSLKSKKQRKTHRSKEAEESQIKKNSSHFLFNFQINSLHNSSFFHTKTTSLTVAYIISQRICHLFKTPKDVLCLTIKLIKGFSTINDNDSVVNHTIVNCCRNIYETKICSIFYSIFMWVLENKFLLKILWRLYSHFIFMYRKLLLALKNSYFVLQTIFI